MRLRKDYLLLSLLIFTLDQASKYLVKTKLGLYESVPVIKGFFQLAHIRNSGAIWGMFSNHPQGWVPLAITALSIIALGLVIFFFFRISPRAKLELLSVSMILGGALGNIFDRLTQGYVVDFFDVYIKSAHWPTFNVADSFITIGVILMGISIFLTKDEKKPVLNKE